MEKYLISDQVSTGINTDLKTNIFVKMLSIILAENIKINYKTYISIINKIWTVIPALSIMAKISEDYIFAFLFGEKIDSKLLQGSIFCLYLHSFTGFHFLFIFTFSYRVPFSVHIYI